jgi:hypothetical protein
MPLRFILLSNIVCAFCCLQSFHKIRVISGNSCRQMRAVVTGVVIDFVHVAIFVRVSVCYMQVHEACMHTNYQNDTGNNSVQVHIKDVCANVHDATWMQNSVVLR